MEKFDELRKEWIVTLKTLKSIPTQTLYFLIEPDDNNKFFESVDSFKDCMEGTNFSAFVSPTLTTIDQPLERIGNTAFLQLRNVIEKQTVGQRSLLLAARLIRRQSA